MDDSWKTLKFVGMQSFRIYQRLNVGPVGPPKHRGFWPVIPKTYWEAYSQEAAKLRVRPSPVEITRADDFFASVADLEEADRIAIHGYLRGRCIKSLSVSRVSKDVGVPYSTFRWRIDEAFKRLWEKSRDLAFIDNSANEKHYNRKTHLQTPTHWRSEDQSTPDWMPPKDQQRRELEAKLLKQAKARAKRNKD
jgi:hypothetical protein